MARPPQPRYVLVSYLRLEPQQLDWVSNILCGPRLSDSRHPRSLLRDPAGNRLLELTAFDELSNVDELLAGPAFHEITLALRPRLGAGFRRQLYEVDEVVKAPVFVPSAAPYLRLTRMEVAQSALDQYVGWRKRSLFPHAAQHPGVAAFVAYQPVVSTEPGMLFLSAFSSPENGTLESTPEYSEWIREAGERYALGGSNAISTSVWQRHWLSTST
ncbi:MAG: hypothetical protein ACOY0T_30550 [Myxococcota bacterium]